MALWSLYLYIIPNPILLNMAYSRIQLVEMSRQPYGDRSTLSLLLTLPIPLDPQHGPPCSRQECLSRHTATTATTFGMPLDLEAWHCFFLSYSCRSLPSPTPLSDHLYT